MIANIPATATGLPEGLPKTSPLPDGSIQGRNDFYVVPGANPIGYDGPAASGHHYRFTLYALDTALDLPPEFTPAQFKAALAGHILDQKTITGISP